MDTSAKKPEEANPKVLVVDDTEDNLDLLEFALRKRPLTMLRANGGRECLEIAAKQDPDIILLDIQMPDMDGFETLKRLQENPKTKKIPVVFLTAAKKDPKSIEEGLMMGASEYLTKPIDIEELLVRTKSILKLSRMEKELEETKAKFTAMLVHDLRSPLGGIKSVFELLIDVSREGKSFGPEIMQIIESAHSSSASLLELVNDLLDLSKYQAGQVHLDRASVDMASVLEMSLSSFSVPFQNKGVKLKRDYVADLSMVSMDPRKISQVVGNLVSNALKFTPKDGSVTVRTKKDVIKQGGADRDAVVVEVEDTGMGIPKDEQSLLFSTYRQVSSARKVKEKGTGLGLAICKLIVEAHGGTVGLDSEAGKGTTFRFTIPMTELTEQS